jgi:hypothetical protein
MTKFSRLTTFILVLLGVSLHINACGNDLPQKGKDFVVLKHGAYCRVMKAGVHLIENKGDFRKYWTDAFGTDAPLPEVDFNHEVVIAVFRGSQRTGGYEVSIGGIIPNGDDLVVKVTYTDPGPKCIVTMAFSYPFLFASVSKPKGKVQLKETRVVKQCGE